MRLSRPHPFNNDGRQVLAPSVAMLTAAERARIPAYLAQRFGTFRELIQQAPPPFDWLAGALSERVPVLECSRFDEREYWRICLAGRHADLLTEPCFGFDGAPCGAASTPLPSSLAWLRATFGTIVLAAEQSGSAPFGRTVREISAQDRAAVEAIVETMKLAGYPTSPMHDRWAELRVEHSAAIDAWLSLYEVDGDWIFADPENDQTIWAGAEWTGTPATRFDLPWSRAVNVILRRTIDGEAVRPADLERLVTSAP